LGSFASAALNVALPSLNQEFRADAIAQNWVVTSFVLTMAIVSIPSEGLADISE
jgi:MFS family permease